MSVERFVPGPQGAAWTALVASLPAGHVLQTWEWAQVKARLGWQALPHVWQDEQGRPVGAALILQRAAPLPLLSRRLRIFYLPKGPLLDWQDAGMVRRALDDLQTFARRRGGILLKIDPDAVVGRGVPGTDQAVDDPAGMDLLSQLGQRGWLFSKEQIQFRNTVVVDLSAGEEALLGRMKQKTRYNIRLAERKGVKVRPGGLDDLPLLYRMYAETSLRDGFVIREQAYYLYVWETFMRAGMAEALIAEVEGQPVGAVILFRSGAKAWYLYGMSRDLYRELMPNHLLQWEAMRRSRQAGCATYDFWGAPDVFDESDSMWGVFRFKEGFSGLVQRTVGAWDYPVSPLLYRLYTQTLPRLLDIMRRRGQAQTRQEMSS